MIEVQQKSFINNILHWLKHRANKDLISCGKKQYL